MYEWSCDGSECGECDSKRHIKHTLDVFTARPPLGNVNYGPK